MSKTKAELAREAYQAAGATAKKQREQISDLVHRRMWRDLDFQNHLAAWESVNVGKCPTEVKVLSVLAMAGEGMNTAGNGNKPNGHTHNDVAKAIGVSESTVSVVLAQFGEGVPTEHIATSGGSRVRDRIAQYSTRARQHPRLSGKLPYELVNSSLCITRSTKDEIRKEARKDGITDAEMTRRLLELGLAVRKAQRTKSAA